MKKLLIFLLLCFILFLLLGYFCAYKILAPAIEADIKNKVQSSLIRNNLASVQVETNGRDITLRGVVSSEQLKAKALRVAAVDGYHTIENKITIHSESPKVKVSIEAYTMSIRLKNDQSIILSGFVPDAKTKNKILSLASSRYGKPHISDDISLKAKAPSNWQKALVVTLNSFSHLKQGQVKISNNKFELSGLTDSKESRLLIGKYLEANLPKNYIGSLDIATMSNKALVDELKLSKKQLAIRCQEKFKDLLAKNKIHFETGGAVLADKSFTLLDQLVLVVMNCPNQIILIEGYTDSKGSEKRNKILSQKRAQAVADYLQEKGINKNKLKVKGYGEEKPIASNQTPEGRALNRRIEFIVEGVK